MSASVAAFYINLDKRADRREHIEAQLKHAGLTAERVSAVTPADLAPARIAAASSHLSPIELACNESHRKIWQMILDRGIPGALIIEDDALLSNVIPSVLATPDLATRVDALQFESHPSNALLGKPLPSSGGATLNRLMSSSLGTCAYYITARFAAQLLGNPVLEQLAVDRVLFGRGGGLIYTARIYQTVPALAVQLDAFAPGSAAARSDLEADRMAGRGKRRRSLGTRLAKIALNTGHAMRVLSSFAPTGELIGSRQLQLPIAHDIQARL